MTVREIQLDDTRATGTEIRLRPFADLLEVGGLDALCAGAVERSFAKGHTIFAEGTVSERLFLVQSGDVKLTKTSARGTTTMLELSSAGHLIGDHAALHAHPHDVTAQAATGVTTWEIRRAGFSAALATEPGLLQSYLEYLGMRLREAGRQSAFDHSADCFGRLCRRLLELADRHGVQSASGIVVDSPVSQDELAQWIGVSRDGVVRAFARGRRLGWMQTFRGGFVLHDLDAVLLQATY